MEKHFKKWEATDIAVKFHAWNSASVKWEWVSNYAVECWYQVMKYSSKDSGLEELHFLKLHDDSWTNLQDALLSNKTALLYRHNSSLQYL